MSDISKINLSQETLKKLIELNTDQLALKFSDQQRMQQQHEFFESSLMKLLEQYKKDELANGESEGDAIEVRLIVAVVKGAQDKTVARWSLISNVSSEIDAIELTTGYYWRWTIECYFKLLKQAGHDIEAWLQTTPEAILRRLLISSMACILTWRIQRSEDKQNQTIRAFLAHLSGRQQKRGKLESAPALLAGLSILLNTLQLLSEYSIEELNEIATIALGT